MTVFRISPCAHLAFVVCATCSTQAAPQSPALPHAPLSLKNTTVFIQKKTDKALTNAYKLNIYDLQSIGSSMEEYDTTLNVARRPILKLSSDKQATIKHLEYYINPKTANGGNNKASLSFEYKTEDGVRKFSFDNSGTNAENNIYNITFTENKEGNLIGEIKGYETGGSDNQTVEGTYIIFVCQGEVHTPPEIIEKTPKPYTTGNKLNGEFVNWIVEHYFQQFKESPHAVKNHARLYTPQVERPSFKKKITREAHLDSFVAYAYKCPERVFKITQVGVKKNSIQVLADYCSIDNEQKQESGSIMITLKYNTRGLIEFVDIQFDNTNKLKLESGYKRFSYKGETLFLATD